jgi:hypothetical protein
MALNWLLSIRASISTRRRRSSDANRDQLGEGELLTGVANIATFAGGLTLPTS